MKRKFSERVIEGCLFLSASTAILVIILIALFVFKEGLPALKEVGVGTFIFSSEWSPTYKEYGTLPMIVGSLAVTLVALIISVPLGISCAVFLAEIAPRRVARAVRPAVELLAGIPSVIYGFFGLVIIVPSIKVVADWFGFSGISGFSVLASAIILAIMILPTIISISEDAIRAVPKEYKEGSLALGATHWKTIDRVILPAASSGIIAGVVLGMGRAIGETMAVMMVAGNTPWMPEGLLSPVRTLTANVAIEMSYASGLHREALFATGIILFVIIFCLNVLATTFSKRRVG